jgi:hypothetical protein
MRIEITGRGIYGANGEVAVGTVLTLKNEPKGWAGRYRVIGTTEGKEPVNGQDNASSEDKPSERDELKKQAAELGIEYPKNISTEKLRELIDAKLAA